MSLTKEDLRAIGALISNRLDEKLTPINERLDTVDKRLDTMQADIAELKYGVDHVRGSVVVIENEHGRKINSIYEGYMDTQRKTDRIQPLEETVEDHDARIWALEQVVKAN